MQDTRNIELGVDNFELISRHACTKEDFVHNFVNFVINDRISFKPDAAGERTIRKRNYVL